MTHYRLTQLATHICGHSADTACCCPCKTPSTAVAGYLERAKRRYPKAIVYNPEFFPYQPRERFNADHYRWIENPTKGLRLVGKAHEIESNGAPSWHDAYQDVSPVKHTGWYTDEYHDSSMTIWGEVYQLPTRRNGEPRYIPAVSDPNNNGAYLDFHSITSDLQSAVSWSDTMAERWAEDERKYQAGYERTQRIEEITGELATLRENRKSLIREIRSACSAVTPFPAIVSALRAQLMGMRADGRELHDERKKLENA